MVYRPSSALRHEPKQLRGERKVEQILRSAEAVFAEVGYEQATTNAVALHAGISIGSLYQFFASKDAILESMAAGYLENTRVVMSSMLESAGEKTLRQLLTEIIEALVKLQNQRPYFLQCLGTANPYAVLDSSVTELKTVVTREFEKLLQRISLPADEEAIRLRAELSVRAASGLLPVVMSVRGKRRASVMAECVTLICRYLEPDLVPAARS